METDARPHEIESARLRLRPLAEADVEELHALWSSPEVRKYLWDDEVIACQRTASLVEESLRLFAIHGYGLWGAKFHDREELVGFGGFWYFHTPPKLELLYGIAPQHWNRSLQPRLPRRLSATVSRSLSSPRSEPVRTHRMRPRHACWRKLDCDSRGGLWSVG
jgi:RimJ/RimL family protein N-acetyltransferase